MEVKFCNVGYIYNDKTPLKKTVLKDIDLTLKEGKIYSIVGKSGSGKTTILELLNGLLLPTSGYVKVDNFKLERGQKYSNINDLRMKIGLVFQFPEEQFFCKTVRKEIEFAMNCFKYKLDELDKRIVDALKMVGLDETFLDRDPFTLSNGEMRKVAIASILAFNPKIIVLDEPTIGLDCSSKDSLIRLMKLLKKRYKKTIIIVSHDTDILLKISDEVSVVNNGKIVLSGNKYDVLSDERVMKANGIRVPKLLAFSNLVKKKKNVHLGYRDEINDLIKDIYRYVK